jgi:hypothetical protein
MVSVTVVLLMPAMLVLTSTAAASMRAKCSKAKGEVRAEGGGGRHLKERPLDAAVEG